MLSRSRLTCFFVLTLSLSLPSVAQEATPLVVGGDPASEKTGRLSAEERNDIVERLSEGIEKGYVLEEKGRDIAAQLRQMGATGRFTDDDPQKLADALSETLREISGDLHFRVTSGSMANAMGGPRRQMVRVPAGASEAPAGAGPTRVRRVGGPGEGAAMSGEMGELFTQMSERFPDNYRAKVLPGNVGLLEIDILFPPHDRLDAALQELADTDALILDVRSCPGGTGFTTRPLESVFFAETTHLMTMAQRGEEPVRIETTDDTPGGVKYLGKPVYILTSNRTGSACEEVSWNLKYHDKAVLVGETTAGAGHGISGSLDLGHSLTATIPSMRPIHPRFEGGWEGVGVPPDVTINSRRAADEAHLLALSAIMENAEGTRLGQLESIYATTSMEVARKERGYVDQGRSLRNYSSSFEKGRSLYVKDGELFYSDGRPRGPLVELDERDQFEFSTGMTKMILKVERGGNGEIQGLAISREGRDEWKRFKRVSTL